MERALGMPTGDDLGRSVTQHKPLNKGPYAQAGLAKSFADTEHGQRPRVWAPAEVHKQCSRTLCTEDIDGAQVCEYMCRFVGAGVHMCTQYVYKQGPADPADDAWNPCADEVQAMPLTCESLNCLYALEC